MHATRVKRTEAVSRSKGMSTLVVFSVQQRITHIAACETDPADAVYLPKSMTAQNPQELAAFLESLEDYVPTVALYNMQLLLRPREGVVSSHSHVLSVS